MKINFKDLSVWLKIAVFTSWITAVIYGVTFTVAFVAELV